MPITGHLEQIKKGYWKVVINLGKDPVTGKYRRIVRRIRGSKPEADSLKAQLITELERGTFVAPAKITVAEWLDTWLNEYKKLDLRDTTWESYEIMARVHLKPAIGNLQLKDLRPEHLQQLYNKKYREDNKSSRTVRYIHQVIHGALEQAVKNGLVAKNVSDATTLPPEDKEEAEALSVEQQDRFLSMLGDDRLGAAFIVLLGTGLRRGEVLGLKWQDIDLENRLLHVRRGIVRTRKGIKEEPPKTEKAKRTVPLPLLVIEVLRQHRDRMQQEGNYYPDGPVFCTKNGTFIYPRNFNRTFERLRKKAGIEHVRLHVLRHTFATRLLELGEDLKVVQELLGHARLNITADIYSHVTEKLKRRAVDKLDNIFSISTNLAPKKAPEDGANPPEP